MNSEFLDGFRPHTTASQTYEEDLAEIVLADRLGFRDAYISERHGEPVYMAGSTPCRCRSC